MFVLIQIITLGVRRLKIYLSSLLSDHEGSRAETMSQFPTMKEVERKSFSTDPFQSSSAPWGQCIDLERLLGQDLCHEDLITEIAPLGP